MPLYITLYKFTDNGIKNIKSASKRYEEGAKQWEAMGGKIIGFYATLGEYDYVSIAEGPSDESVMAFALGLGSQGNVRTTTLKAFTQEDFARIVGKLP